MKPKKPKQYKTCDFCGRVGLLGYMSNPTPGWIFKSEWMCKNAKACTIRVLKNKKDLYAFKWIGDE